ncbi:MAG: hypothetical protein ACRDZ1_09255 [Acidimicrobiia bacterium]
MGALLAVAQTTESGLDDHDPAYQRPGFLDLGELPEPAPQVTGDIPAPGRRALVFFDRPSRVERLCDALAGNDLLDRADVAIVVAGHAPRCGADLSLVSDPRGRLAQEFGLHEPRDDGPSVGYAVVDSGGEIRYRTLDPAAAGQLDEVSTILTATP